MEEWERFHPLTAKQFRQPADADEKNDPNDLAAIARAAINGFGLREPQRDPLYEQLCLPARHRRDLVEKRAALNCQIREHLDAVLPGYADCFAKLWSSNVLLLVAAHYGSAAALQAAGERGICRFLDQQNVRYHRSTVDRIVTWAANAAEPHEAAHVHHRIWQSLEADRREKTLKIQALEQDLAGLLVQTPYVLLLSHPGINVVSAAELAGELGPIRNYPTAKSITGRAGLFPGHYQSHHTDRDGKLVRACNHALRAALMRIAENLLTCNQYYRALGARWKAGGKEAKEVRVCVAARFTRVAFQIVSGGQVFKHPSQGSRHYVLDKLMDFHHDHGTPPDRTLSDLNMARTQVPEDEYENEASPLMRRHEAARRSRRRGVQPVREILLAVLAKLGVGALESEASEDQGSS